MIKTRRGGIVELICRQDCPHKCERYLAGEIEHDDPSEACPISWKGAWHATEGFSTAATLPARPRSVEGGPEVWGPIAWRWLHGEAFAGRLDGIRIIHEFLPMILCGRCLTEARRVLKEIPFRQADQDVWSWEFHNAINAHLGKREWSYEEAAALYSTPT